MQIDAAAVMRVCMCPCKGALLCLVAVRVKNIAAFEGRHKNLFRVSSYSPYSDLKFRECGLVSVVSGVASEF